MKFFLNNIGSVLRSVNVDFVTVTVTVMLLHHPTYMMYFRIGIVPNWKRMGSAIAISCTGNTFDHVAVAVAVLWICFEENLVATSDHIRQVGMTDGDILTIDTIREGFLRSTTDPYSPTISCTFYLLIPQKLNHMRCTLEICRMCPFSASGTCFNWFESSFGKIPQLAEIEHSNLLCHCCLCGHSLVVNEDSISSIVRENLEKKKDQAGGRSILSVWNQRDANKLIRAKSMCSQVGNAWNTRPQTTISN